MVASIFKRLVKQLGDEEVKRRVDELGHIVDDKGSFMLSSNQLLSEITGEKKDHEQRVGMQPLE